ncbi:hypothetical protein AURDEDRAFT_150623 [Auricularia subglabra TFB-10046 SS5]|nr:hypothetical protein AURDEDRAFT_150623 [Auricularia subglabra TFB-10046 SS5]
MRLPLADLCTIAMVCSSWRDMSESLPSLWTYIAPVSSNINLARILSLSRDLPFEIWMYPDSTAELTYMDTCIRDHAARLRDLHVGFGTVDSMTRSDGSPAFNYPVPRLTTLSMIDHYPLPFVVHLPGDLFAGCAPLLRHVKLNVVLPLRCPALASVPSAEVHDTPAALARLFDVLPALRTISLMGIGDYDALPPVPQNSPLAKVVIDDSIISPTFAQLDSLGYTRIRELSVYSSNVAHIAEAAGHAAHFPTSVLRLGACDLSLHLVRAHGCTLRFGMTDDVPVCELQSLVEWGPSFSNVRTLVLPSHFTGAEDAALAILSGSIALPGVETLAINCSSRTPHSLFSQSLALELTRLTRIEFLREPGVQGALEPIDAHCLVDFIVRCLKPDDPRSIEIRNEPCEGIQLRAGDADLPSLLEVIPGLRPHVPPPV